MIETTTSPMVLGLELDSIELRGALLIYKQNKPTLGNTFKIKIDQEQPLPVKLLYTKEEEKKFYSLSHKSLTTTTIASSEVLIRDLEVLLTKEKDIDQVLEFQTEPLLPYSIEEAIIDRIVVAKSADRTGLTIASVKKEHLAAHLEQWHSLGVEPEVISCVPAALAAFSEQFNVIKEPHFVLHLGATESTCCLVENGNLLSAQSYKYGVKNLLDALNTDLKEIEPSSQENLNSLNYESLSEVTHPSFYRALHLYRQETTKILFYLAKHAPKKELPDVLLTGEGAAFKNLTQSLFLNLKKTLHEPLSSPQFPISSEELAQFAVPIGIALTSLPKTVQQINFRQKEFIYPYPWKRIKKPVAIYFCLSLLLAGAIYLFSQSYIGKQEDDLKKSYFNLLVLMKKPFAEFEQELQKKEPTAHTFSHQKEIDPSSLTSQDVSKRLNLLEKEIRESPDVFPLLPNTPRVSDVLAWLSSHPHIKGEGESEATRIHLESFNYKMIKRPESNKNREKYQVKVDIEFTALTPRYAREFHDILLAPNEIIDPNSEINWSTERGKYRASFFLKDKTLYPTSKPSSL